MLLRIIGLDPWKYKIHEWVADILQIDHKGWSIVIREQFYNVSSRQSVVGDPFPDTATQCQRKTILVVRELVLSFLVDHSKVIVGLY